MHDGNWNEPDIPVALTQQIDTAMQEQVYRSYITYISTFSMSILLFSYLIYI